MTDAWQIFEGDALEVLRGMEPGRFDALVTDPPYGLEFMGKEWDRLGDIGKTSHAGPRDRDGATVFGRQRVAYSGSSNLKCRKCEKWQWDYPERKCTCAAPDFPNIKAHQSRIMQAWHEEWARVAYRVLKPGAHLVAFGGSRTWHRLASAIEDAGFEIRDTITWHFGSGFPKSLNVSDALESLIPDRELCACARHSTETTEDSQSDCPPNRCSDGGQLPLGPVRDPDAAPSEGDAPARIRAGRPRGAPVGESASSDSGEGSGRPSTADSSRASARPSEGFQSNDSTQCDTGANTSRAASKATHRTAPRKSHTPDSDVYSALDTNIPQCGYCGKGQIPQGLGTALKPSTEFIVLARKPLVGTVAANVAAHGTGALNVDGCRVGAHGADAERHAAEWDREWSQSESPMASRWDAKTSRAGGPIGATAAGRWPPNLLLMHAADCGEECVEGCPVREMDRQSGELVSGTAVGGLHRRSNKTANCYGAFVGQRTEGDVCYGDSGGASRFFPRFRYVAKASSGERNAGLEGMPEELGLAKCLTPLSDPRMDREQERRPKANYHPTVKPVALMRWLCRLVTPPGGLVLDPFLGSGTTMIAALQEGFRCVGVEREAEYAEIARRRVEEDAPLFNRSPAA